MPFCDVKGLVVGPTARVRDVMIRINTGLRGIALVVDGEDRLIGTLTDGDVRRAILAEVPLDACAGDVLRAGGGVSPITAPIGTDPGALVRLMREHSIRQVPLLDAQGHAIDLVTLDDLVPQRLAPQEAVIMAGGTGLRLRPLTDDTPKPMLPVGGRPLMEHIVDGLRRAGIQRVTVATHYKPDKIVSHFGNGDGFGVKFTYLTESQPLGTAGALGLMGATQETMLVINGDVLTEVDFRAMLAYHREYDAVLTLAVRKYDMSVPYGVVERHGARVLRVVEKPVFNFFVNAGIYLLEPVAYQYIPPKERFDMTDLIERLLAEGRSVVSFPILEYWTDIGHYGDYEQAQEYIRQRQRI